MYIKVCFKSKEMVGMVGPTRIHLCLGNDIEKDKLICDKFLICIYCNECLVEVLFPMFVLIVIFYGL